MPIPDPTSFLLVLARCAGLVMGAPIFGHLLVPLRGRVGLALLFAIALAPVATTDVTAPPTLWTMAGLVVVESILGFVLGFIAQMIFAGVQLGGQLAGMEIGFGLSNLIDPQSNAQSTVVAEWQQLMALLVFLALDVHHLLLRALIESFRVVPLGAAVVGGGILRGVAMRGGEIFAIGMRIAAPVLLVLLLTNAALGVLARTIPQLNVFVVGFPVNVGVGLIVLGASLPFTFRFLAQEFADLGPTLGMILRGFVDG
jgi:flagellar biosynthesis protein FliR